MKARWDEPRRPSAEAQPTAELRELRECLAYLHAQLSSGVPANFLGALILAALVWEAVAPGPLIVWVGLVFAVTVYRWIVRLRSASPETASAGELRRDWSRVRAGIVASGVVWGLASLLAYPVHSTLQESAFVVIVAGMVAGAVPMVAVRFGPYAVNCLAALLPLAARLVSHGDASHVILGATTIILAGMMLRSARDFSRVFLESASLRARLEALAELDELTGLANRRRFEREYAREWSTAARHRRSLAVLVVDVDHFKAYNDHYGHLAGDRCLVALGEVLCSAVRRPPDLVARMGGEEFVVLLPEADLDGAVHVAQRMRELVRARALPHQASPAGQTVSVSIGVAATVPAPDAERAQLLEEADRALYRAKEAGRDRVEGGAGAVSPPRLRVAGEER